MTDKTPAMTELPEPELGYIETDKSRQPAFSARQMREALQSAQPAAAVSDESARLAEQLSNIANGVRICGVHDRHFVSNRLHEIARAILAMRPQALAGEREAFEAWFDDYYDKACAEFGGIDCTDPKGIAEDAWQARASLPTQPAAQATPQADPLNPGWCVGCNPDNCMGCGIGLNKAQATPDQFADASKMVAPVALRSVHLTRDTAGMCVVRINGRVAIRDNGDLIDHTATLEWFADTQQATPEPVGDVRCEGCGYMTHHREHMGCVRAAKQHTRPAPGVPEGLQWFTVAERGMPDFDEEVIAGLWYTDPCLKPEFATRFMWGLCRVFKDDYRDFKDGKRWHTFGPSHNQITHWARFNWPALAAQAKGDDK